MDRGGFVRVSERVALERLPVEIDGGDLVDCFTLDQRDLDLVMGRREAPARVAMGLSIGALRLMGFVPEDLATAPVAAVSLVAGQVRAEPGDLEGHRPSRGGRWRIVSAVESHLGFRRARDVDLKGFNDWLVDRAMEHDEPWALFRSGCAWLKSEKVVRVGVTVLERAVIAARQKATERTYMALAGQLHQAVRGRLDSLLVVADDASECPLASFRRAPAGRVAAQISGLVNRLDELRAVGGQSFDLSGVASNRVRHLAGLGRRMSPKALRRLSPERRYQILVATIEDTTVRTIDQILDLFDVAVTAVIRPSETAPADVAHRSSATERLVGAFAAICELVLDPDVDDGDLRATIMAAVGRDEIIELEAEAAEMIESRRGLSSVLSSRYRTARRFSTTVLGALSFDGPSTSADLLTAIEGLCDLNRSGARKVPTSAPVSFLRGRWKQALHEPDGTISRHVWELALLVEMRGALRSGDLWVHGSDRYQDPARFMIGDNRWARDRDDHGVETGVGTDAAGRSHRCAGRSQRMVRVHR